MNRYVVDTSVLVQYFITDRYSSEATVLCEGIGERHVLYVPEFSILECINVLWKNVRFQGMPDDVAATHVSNLIDLDLMVIPVAGYLSQSLEIGLRHQLAIYDSVYIAIARRNDYPLVTDDDRQKKAAIAEGISIKAVTDFVDG